MRCARPRLRRRYVAALCAARAAAGFCLPPQSCWPPQASWDALNASVGGRLLGADDPDFAAAGGMYYPQWDQPIAYAVAARGAGDVRAAVRFANATGVRLAVKNNGHSMNGQSTAEGALLVWTHAMQGVAFDPAFDDGCGGAPVDAVTVGAGVDWATVYAATSARGKLAVGGQCPDVGAAGGYVQGGGHSALGHKFGLSSDNVVSLSVVTPAGELVGASRCAHPDLFWALRGGGGGTFGVVTSVTHRIHPAPPVLTGYTIVFPLSPPRGRAFFAQVLRLVKVLGPEWGGYVNTANVESVGLASVAYLLLLYQGGRDAGDRELAALKGWYDSNRRRLDLTAQWLVAEHASFWEWHQSRAVRTVSGFPFKGLPNWVTSVLIPAAVLTDEGTARVAGFLSDGVYNASNLACWGSILGGRVSEPDNTSAVSPHIRAAQLHVACALFAADAAALDRRVARFGPFTEQLRGLAPGGGAYLNEADYNEPNWKDAFWGENYARLLQVKQAYDPGGLLTCHHCVGSE